ncbi:hypothetical protein CALCODRAFT_510408 [Calocera cornea HHB12733]|uniref:Uncharacterized protein n=1 Tax=Calocera cornea HHB12733 TaxID=1353952 RepID=A0A165EJI4_9BASI|nr:hypothetical protein CALCODRAFT_510408 [Calocera cornea HHB12733]
MILRVVPPAPGLTILFTLSFPALPAPLPFPPAWSATLSLAISHNLAPPPSAHALDRACTTIELLHSVTFDIARRVVECRIVDDELIVLPLRAELRNALERVCADVSRSTEELEREKRGIPSAPPTASAGLPTSPSLLSLISSFIPSLHSAPSSPTTSTHTLALSPPTPPSRFYRRQARSSLVDAYARWVQPELAMHVSAKGAGGWGAWTARAALRKASQELDELLAPSEPPSPASSVSSCSEFPALPPTPALSHASGLSTPSTPSTSTQRFASPSLSAAQLSSYSRLTSRIQEMKGLLATLEEREREWRDGEIPRKMRPEYRPGRSALGLHVTSAEEETEDALMSDASDASLMTATAQQSKSKISFPSLPAPPMPTSLPPPPMRATPPPRLTLRTAPPRPKTTRGIPYDALPARRKPVPAPIPMPTAFRIPSDGDARVLVVGEDASDEDGLAQRLVGMEVDKLHLDMDVDRDRDIDMVDVVMHDGEAGPPVGRRNALDLPRGQLLAGW